MKFKQLMNSNLPGILIIIIAIVYWPILLTVLILMTVMGILCWLIGGRPLERKYTNFINKITGWEVE